MPSFEQLPPAEHYHFAGRSRLPVLLLAGRKDFFGPEADAQTLLRVIPFVEKELVLYDSGHQLPAEYTRVAGSGWGGT